MPVLLLIAAVAVAIVSGVWVLVDARLRLTHRPAWEGMLWALGTAVPFTFPIFLPMYLLGARAPDPSGTWGPAEILGMAIFFIATLPLVAVLAGVFPGQITLPGVSVFIVLQNLGFVLLTLFGIVRRYRLPPSRLGLHTRAWPRLAVAGLLVGALTIGVTLVAERAAVSVATLVEGRERALARAEREHASDPLAGILKGVEGGEIAWLVVLLGVIVPIGEETYFRGVLYGGLRNRWGIGWALAGSTLVFGIVHQQVVHFLPIVVLGLILVWLYERSGSLLPAIVVHGVNNVVAILGRLYGWNL